MGTRNFVREIALLDYLGKTLEALLIKYFTVFKW